MTDAGKQALRERIWARLEAQGLPISPAPRPRRTDRRGARVGKRGDYSDLEFALVRRLGAVDEDTPVLTTVHEMQIVDEDIPMTAHDVPVDLIVTPERVIRSGRRRPMPAGIRWNELSDEQIAAMPPLLALGSGRGRRTR